MTCARFDVVGPPNSPHQWNLTVGLCKMSFPGASCRFHVSVEFSRNLLSI